MKLKYTSLLFILSFSLMLPLRAENKAVITELNINNNEANKTTFNLSSIGKFNYYIHSSQNSLLIDIKGANIDPNILNKFNYNNSNIENIQFKKTSDSINTIIIDLKDIKDIKFSVNAPNGRLYPYGFDNINIKPTVTDKFSSDNIVKIESKDINISETPKETKNSLQLKPKISLAQPEYDMLVPSNALMKNSNTLTNTSNGNNRLNENIVIVPKEQPKEEIKQQKTDIVSQKGPETSKQDLIINPISSQELIKRLNSDTTEVPRLIEIPENTKNTQETKHAVSAQDDTTNKEVINNKADIKETASTNALISSIKSVPKGTFINASISNPQIITPDGSKVIEVPDNTLSPDSNQIALSSENNQKLLSGSNDNTFVPRSLNSMPLGLFEEYDNFRFDNKTKLKDLKPKPNLASDGSIAFTVISAEGVVEGKVPIKTLNNTTTVNPKIINNENSKAPRDNVSMEFKKTINKGLKLQSESNFAEAEEAFEDAINQSPNQPWGYIAIASFYESQSRPQEAIKSYESALRSLPNKIELLNNLAINYYQIKNYEKAKNVLLRIISIAPSFTLAYYNLGTIYYSLNNNLKASEYLKRAVELNPVLNDARYNLGLAYMGLKMKSAALRQVEEALSTDPDDPELKLLLTKLK